MLFLLVVVSSINPLLDDDGSGPILIESDRPRLDSAFRVDIVGLGCGKGCGLRTETSMVEEVMLCVSVS
jgi:hypothetical protein